MDELVREALNHYLTFIKEQVDKATTSGPRGTKWGYNMGYKVGRLQQLLDVNNE